MSICHKNGMNIIFFTDDTVLELDTKNGYKKSIVTYIDIIGKLNSVLIVPSQKSLALADLLKF